jgi:cellobiose phosphorylase
MAGDICSQPPYVGRGGWSWYTGAAAWMHRAAIESIFGLPAREAEALGSVPLLPPGHALSWDGLAPDSCYVVPLPALVPEAQAAPTPT